MRFLGAEYIVRKLARWSFFPLAFVFVVVVRLIRPLFLIRFYSLSGRMGHFAANTELYLCEQDAGFNVPKQPYFDLFGMPDKIPNRTMENIWRRYFYICPSFLFRTIELANKLIPGGSMHEISSNTQHDRDVFNLLGGTSPHVQLTPEEEIRGIGGLLSMGIPKGAHFVCLLVRDSAYLESYSPPRYAGQYDYHNYRDCNIKNYILAVEELAHRGYFVIRMGAKVREPLEVTHPKVIDYAWDGRRDDFMDIYLASKCEFFISTSTGLDAVAWCVFRKPIVYTNFVSVGYFPTYLKKSLIIPKKHVCIKTERELSLSEIFERGVGFSINTSRYESEGVALIENTPEEIRDIAVEMLERLTDIWKPDPCDQGLQDRFWKIYSEKVASEYEGPSLHGEIQASLGAQYLRHNQDWVC